ncbi:MAG: hypothetical protein ABIW76_03745 [Fibrobacteria bacterium]
MNRRAFVLAFGTLIGALMNGEAGTARDSVYLLEFEFKWNGETLSAGRMPVYGKEVPMVDRPAGDFGSAGDEVVRLSPFPIRFPQAIQDVKPTLGIGLYPRLPSARGVLKIGIRLVASREALRNWAKDGVAGNDPEEEWAKSLEGPNPGTLAFEIRKRGIVHKDPRTRNEFSELGRFAVALGKPVEAEFPLTELAVDEERYEIRFPEFGFEWERKRSYLPLKWLKGKPEERAVVPASQSGSGESGKQAPVKRPFWKFW